MTPVTPLAKFYMRWLPTWLVPVAMILTYTFFLLAIGLTVGTTPPDLMYIDVRDN
jgi:ABC-type transport system involved in cytochrome c biogenesis permease subunit